jgi:hypothetical protein
MKRDRGHQGTSQSDRSGVTRTKTPCAGKTSAWAAWREIEDTRTSRSAPGRKNRCTEMLQCRDYSERYTSAIILIINIISKAAP